MTSLIDFLLDLIICRPGNEIQGDMYYQHAYSSLFEIMSVLKFLNYEKFA